MRIDDDSWFNKPIDFDLFDFALDSPVVTAYTWRHETWRNDQTTEGLWQFYLKYLRDAGIDVSAIRNDSLRKAAITYNGQESFPTSIDISCGNCNIYNLSLFKASRFADWIEAVDLYGGQYKYRWGDIEVIALFTATEFDRPICDLNLVAQGLYEPQLPGTTFAPSISMTKAGPVVFVRNALRACIFYPPRFFHKFFIPLFFRGISKARALARLFLGKS
jgi:hypothetical protein